MSADLITWAMPRLQRLLPIDEESLREIITYTVGLPKDTGAEHLKNMLGDSPQAFEFISGFNSRRPDVKPPEVAIDRSENTRGSDYEGVPKKKRQIKTKAPLHSAGPLRKPEGYGDVSGAYTKQRDEDVSPGRGHKKADSGSSLSNALALSQKPEALQVPKVTQGGLNTPSPGQSRDPSPGKRASPRLPPSAAGGMISDLPNVRQKQSKKPTQTMRSQPQSGASTPHGGRLATTTTSSISDLTSAIAALELSTNPTLSTERRKCECNASIHPLFATAPNCLSCGKIICALEGLQPCSFCDAPILSREQVNGMIRALKEERGIERMATHNASQARSGGGTPLFSSTPDTSGDESSSAAVRARAHRDKLLAFQRENVQRTKVHDEAADYDMTLTPGATQWMGPTQRAVALKKQQQYMRELEEDNKPEWEKKRTVMSMTVKNGKLVKTYERQKAPSRPATEMQDEIAVQEAEAAAEEQRQHLGGTGAFSNNPLLQSGQLIRPVWKPKEGEAAAGKVRREPKNVWRRVQDEQDNEQWLLDGGLRGFGVETRIMEDGSQQECG